MSMMKASAVEVAPKFRPTICRSSFSTGRLPSASSMPIGATLSLELSAKNITPCFSYGARIAFSAAIAAAEGLSPAFVVINTTAGLCL